MAKKAKKNPKEEEKENLEGGQTNLGFEPDIVKTKSKEDISTLNKNLDNEATIKTETVTKKKKFKEKSKAEHRIENDLFEEEKTKKNKKKSSGKKSSSKKRNKLRLCLPLSGFKTKSRRGFKEK